MVVAKSKLAEFKTKIQGYGKGLEERGLVRMTAATRFNIGDKITVGGYERTIISVHLYLSEKSKPNAIISVMDNG